MKTFLTVLPAVLLGACSSGTACYGIAGEAALALALNVQAQSRENPVHAYEGVPIKALRPTLILTDRIYREGDGMSATKVLFVDPRTSRRLRYLEIFEDCDPEWRIYSEESTTGGAPVDEWRAAEPVPIIR